MTDHVKADPDPFIIVGGGMYVVFAGGVFDAGAEAVNDLGGKCDDAGEKIVGAAKVVVGRIVGIGMKIRKYPGNVDDIRGGVMAVVKTGMRKSGLAVEIGEVEERVVVPRTVVDPVEGADGAYGLV
jgi:hypothetical protein